MQALTSSSGFHGWLLGTTPMMDHQVVFERKKRWLTADRKKIEKGKKMGNRKKTGRKSRRIFPTCLFRHPDYCFRTPLTS
jgi:predicted dithiol-disulfide oxidoreductase (DUF899 family)